MTSAGTAGRMVINEHIANYHKIVDALIETIGDAGFNVQLRTDNGLHVVEASDRRTRETFVVTGDDLYTVGVELAGQVGVDVLDV